MRGTAIIALALAAGLRADAEHEPLAGLRTARIFGKEFDLHSFRLCILHSPYSLFKDLFACAVELMLYMNI